jgi:hypothetical protein
MRRAQLAAATVSKGLTEQAANEEKKRLAIQKRLEQGAVKKSVNTTADGTPIATAEGEEQQKSRRNTEPVVVAQKKKKQCLGCSNPPKQEEEVPGNKRTKENAGCM